MATAAFEYLRGTYGGDFEIKSGSVNILTSNTDIAGGNPEAVALTMVNTGANPIYIWWDNTVSAANGILLAANGGFVSLTVRDDNVLPTLDWHAVAAGGASSLSYIMAVRTSAVGGAT